MDNKFVTILKRWSVATVSQYLSLNATVPRLYFFCRPFMLFLSCVCYAFVRVCFIDALWWSPAGKGLASWLTFVMSNCEFVTFQLVSWVRRGTWLYRFLIFALFLTLSAHLTIVFPYVYKKNCNWTPNLTVTKRPLIYVLLWCKLWFDNFDLKMSCVYVCACVRTCRGRGGSRISGKGVHVAYTKGWDSLC